MFLLAVLILGSLSHCACADYSAANCMTNASDCACTDHSGCVVTENATCNSTCNNQDLYEATGDNKKCIVKACTSYDERNCYLNDACVLTEENPTKCTSSCIDYKVYLPKGGKCTISGCGDRKPKSMSVFIRVTRVTFNYGYKSNNNVGVTVMGIQKNTSFYSGSTNQADFNYTNETGFTWDNVKEEDLENIRLQVYTDRQYYIGQAFVNISDKRTLEGTKSNLTIASGDITIPIQNQTLYIEVGVCTSCASADWPCGDPDENELCYQYIDGCSTTCPNASDAHYEPDKKTGICERVCEERKKSSEEKWACGTDFETVPCYVNTAATKGDPECVRTCSKEWYTTNGSTGACDLKSCGERIALLKEQQPCGDNAKCYYDPSKATGDGIGLCVTSCPSNGHFSGTAGADGVCSLKPCAERTVESDAKYPCGDEDCDYDPQTGVCGLKPCADRVVDSLSGSLFPCETQDCFYDPAVAAGGKQCVETCPTDDTHTGKAVNGECEMEVITRGDDTPNKGSWWDGPKIIGLPRMWFVIAAAGVALLLLIIIIVIIVCVAKKKKRDDGYVSINSD